MATWSCARPAFASKATGAFQPLDQKPAFAIKFNEFVSGQEFRGLSKVVLNNSAHDGSFMREWLAAELYHDAGVAAARVTHARAVFNGRNLGFYVLVEAMNKSFLKRGVWPTPGSPISTGLFLVRRLRICMTRSNSRDRPMTGSSFFAGELGEVATELVENLAVALVAWRVLFALCSGSGGLWLTLALGATLVAAQQLDDLLADARQSAPSLTSTCAATPSPSRISPRRMCSVPM